MDAYADSDSRCQPCAGSCVSFTQDASYLQSVFEDLALHSVLVTVEAMDIRQVASPILYEITAGNEGGLFSIDSTSGTISLLSALDFETRQTHALSVTAFGFSGQSAVATVLVFVTDRNDNVPLFVQPSYTGFIAENKPSGTSILQVSATDQDSFPNNLIVYSLSLGNDRFQLDPDTGVLTSQRVLDFESDQSYSLIVLACDSGMPSLCSSAQILVRVTDENDVRPSFSADVFSVQISELALIGSSVIRVQANDSDTNNLTYVLFQGNGDNQFELDVSTGLISVAASLDFELTTFYSLLIIASDGVASPVPANVTIEVMVLDENDNIPSFSDVSYTISIPENISPGSMILTVSANDSDSGSNGAISYSIISIIPSNHAFSIDPTTGIIVSTSNLDFENISRYEIQVAATDHGEPSQSSNALAVIIISDVNDNHPVFEEDVITVRLNENLPNSSQIAIFEATDADTNSQVSYHLQNTEQIPFSIEPTTGIIILTDPLDYESETGYIVEVIASDSGLPSLSSSASLAVQVIDLNDNPPTFSQEHYFVSVSESQAVGSSVLQMVATDRDSGENAAISFMLTAGNLNSTFEIGVETGLITLAKSLDFEQVSSYRLSVSAINSLATNQLVTTVVVTVQLLETNEHAPVFPQTLYEQSIQENQLAGINLITLAASDLDGGPSGQFRYQITSGNERMFFDILNNGTLVTLAPLDREQQETHNLTVIAIDMGIPPLSGSTQVHITVLDINDSPPMFLISTSYTATLLENVGSGTDINISPPLRVSDADDPDSINAEVTFSIILGDPEEVFSINALTGQLQAMGSVDFEQVNTYELIIEVKDNGIPALSSDATVVINILDVNDNPPRIARVPSQVNFTEGQDSLLVFPNITISDADSLPLSLVRIMLTGPSVRTGQVGLLSLPSPPVSTTLSFLDGGLTLWLTGSFSHQELTNLVKNLEYINEDLEPDPSTRFITMQIADGEFQTTTETDVIIQLINDNHPLLDLDVSSLGQDYSVNFTEEGLAVSIAGIVSISDADGIIDGITSVRVNLVDPQDNLMEGLEVRSIPNQFDIQYLNNNTTLIVVAKPPASFEVVQSLIPTVSYFNNADEPRPPLTRTIEVTVSDGQLASPPVSTNISIILTNDPPLLALSSVSDYFVDFVEGGGPVLLSSQPRLSDSDSEQLVNASVTLVTTPDSNNEMLVVGASTVPSLTISSTPHLIEIQGPASLNDYLTILSSVSYNNVLQSPDSLIRMVVFTVSDGSSVSAATAYVSFDLVNDPPVLDLNGPQPGSSVTITYIEGSPPIVITSSGLFLNDIDSPLLQFVFVQLVSSPSTDSEGISIASSVVDPRLTITSSPTSIQINGPASALTFTSALLTITYYNDAEEPTEGNRMIYFTANDGELNSTITSTVIIVRQVNDVPVLLLNNGSTFETLYVEQTPSVPIVNADSILLHDNDNNTFSHLTVTLRNVFDGNSEILGFIDSSNDRSLSVQSVSGMEMNSRVVTFQFSKASSTVSVFQDLIASLTYRSILQEPFAAIREISISINDGIVSSLSQQSTVSIVLLNDNAPIFQRSIYQTRVRENIADIVVTTVVANDADSPEGLFGDQGRVQYQIIGGNDDNAFQIDSTSGEITLQVPRDRESSSINPVLTIQASNPVELDNPILPYPTSFVIITVEDVNDNSPQFLNEPYFYQTTEHAQLGTVVGSVLSVDADAGSNSEVEYTIAQGNVNSVFTINSDSGVISVANSNMLDRERTSTFLLSVTATDGGSPQTSNTTLVVIELQDINDNSPTFSRNRYFQTLSEFTAINSTALTVSALDTDEGINGTVLYSLLGTSAFSISMTTGVVTTLEPLNYESQTTHTFTVVANDGGSPSLSSTAQVMITLLDENDNSPVFQQSSYTNFILEGTPSGQPVETVIAFDPDFGSNAEVRYSITERFVPFAINTQTGTVTVSGILDREAQDLYNFTVQATDLGTPPRSSTVPFAVELLDVNDNSPIFEQMLYLVQLVENVPLLFPVTTVIASDEDEGTNADVSFSFTDTTTLFEIDSSSGEIFTVGSVDFEQQSIHSITIIASDNGQPSLTSIATLIINVTDVNDNQPVFEQSLYQFVITENSAPHIFGTVFALDLDEGSSGDIIYSLSSSDDDSVPFAISSVTGELSLLSSLDREEVSSYNLSIIAIDIGTPPLTSTTSLIVFVEDRNDNPPVFSQNGSYSISVNENIPVGSTLLSVSATDADFGANGNITYQILSGNSLGIFDLDSLSGRLVIIAGSLDAETSLSHSLQVQASDTGIPLQSTVASIFITVIDLNDEPIEILSLSASISYIEQAPPVPIAPDTTIRDGDVTGSILNVIVELIDIQSCCNEIILLETIRDQFPGVSFEFQNSISHLIILGPATPTVMTQILMSLLYVNTNPEPQPGSLTAQITVSDGLFTDTVDITISITIVNDNPPVVTLGGLNANFSTTFTENSQSISIFDQVTITDADSGPQTLHSIVVSILNAPDGNMELLSSNTTGLVDVFPSIGQMLILRGPAPIQDFIDTLSSLQYANEADDPQEPLQRIIEVIASDGQLQSEASFAIVNIIALNDPPTLFLSSSGDFNTTFFENGPPVLLSDADLMLSDPDSVLMQSASIVILDPMDSNDEYLLVSLSSSVSTVRISNSEITLVGPASITNFLSSLRTITYVNNATVPTSGMREIVFNISDGELYSTASAFVQVMLVNDQPLIDLNGPLLSEQNFESIFTEEGTLVNIASDDSFITDTDNTSLSSLTVTIQQSLQGTDEILSVSNVSADLTSTFSNGKLEIRGEADVATYILILRSIQYINIADELSGTFRLLEVVCSDGLLESQPVISTVQYSFINDPPIVTLDEGVDFFTVYQENSPAISIINPRSAAIMDVDSSNISFLVLEAENLLDEEHENFNYTDPIGGLLVRISESLNAQTRVYNLSYPQQVSVATFNQLLLSIEYLNTADEPNNTLPRVIKVLVSDGELTSQPVRSTISIRLIDDNEPFFTQLNYVFNISESAPLGTTLGSAVAIDFDVGDTFLYQFEEADAPFAIHSINGTVSLTSGIDRERQELYELTLRLTRPNPPFSLFGSKAVVVVNIMDVNDNAPTFNQTVFTFNVTENVSIGSQIAILEATDVDAGTNSVLVYSLERTSAFQIDGQTGTLSTAENLNREEVQSYMFSVSVMDSGIPVRLTSAVVSIYILDVNDEAPQFLQPFYFTQIVENTPPGTSLIQLSARDADMGSNAQIRFNFAPISSQFMLDPTTGVISTVSSLIPDTYNFTATAADEGIPQLSSNVQVTIKVISINSTLPVFSQPLYEGLVLENSPEGVSIFMVNALDPLTGNQVNYSLSPLQSEVEYFLIDSKSGLLTTSSVNLDRERQDLHQLQVFATSSDGERMGVAQISIMVLDANDFTPVFTQTTYAFNIVENNQLNAILGAVLAVDMDDIGLNAEIVTYTSSNNNFSINSIGIISSNAIFDRERTDFYSFSVFAIDGGSPPQTSSAAVTVSILDENDEAPFFTESVYQGSVAENQPIRTSILTVLAIDNDLGSNAVVSYSTNSTIFSVDSLSGELSTLTMLDFESSPPLYEVFILATDNGHLSSSTIALISVQDIDDLPPVFTMTVYSIRVLEEQLNSSILRVEATDRDSPDSNHISFNITDGDMNDNFDISLSGVISVVQPLDREVTPLHVLTIQASNLDSLGSRLTSLATVMVEVGDINDNSPVFLGFPYTFSVSESSVGGTILGLLSATDDDTANNANIGGFSIIEGDSEGVFSLDPLSGILHLSNDTVLDREMVDRYNLVVIVSDNGSPALSSRANISITVSDINDETPSFNMPSYNVSVNENTPMGVTIFSAGEEASDGDIGSNAELTFSLSEESDFIITPAGIITVASTLDFESRQLYSITVMAVDGGTPSLTGTTTLTIRVLDQDDLPVEFTIDSYVAGAFENSLVGDTVLTVHAQDPDTIQGNPITYSIQQSSRPSLPFTIDSQSGVVSVLGQLDRETTPMYVFTVLASNLPGESASAVVTIDILDVNDVTPKFTESLFQFQLSESVLPPFDFGQVTAIDEDASSSGEISQYSLVGAPPNIAIDPLNGTLSLVGTLDFEDTQMYVFNVTATDGGNPALTGQSEIIFIVTDFNDNSPQFSMDQYQVTVSENVDIGSIVFTVFAQDADSGTNGEVVYSLVQPSTQFSVNFQTGEVSTLSTLFIQTLTIMLSASDMGTPQLSSITTLEIVVTDANERPTFSQEFYEAIIPENRAVNSLVLQVIASDPDSGVNSNVTYSIDPQDYFSISAETGRVTLSQSLDFETQQTYNLTVFATDAGIPSLSTSATLSIHITDVNDNSPLFSETSYSVAILEDTVINTVILTVNASDADSSNNAALTYSILQDSSLGSIAIDSLSGSIFLIESVDRESLQEIQLLVQTRDGGAPFRTSTIPITINITDVDDSPPVFSQNTYFTSAGEELGFGATIIRVEADDMDIGENANIQYLLTNASFLPLDINYLSGDIFVTSPGLDREMIDNYLLIVEASNPSSPLFTATASVSVTVSDFNDNHPVFDPSSLQFTISESSPVGTIIGRVVASDNDLENNSFVTYSIDSPSTLVSVESTSGEIQLESPLDYESSSVLDLTIIASDMGTPQLSIAANLRITVENTNDEAPTLTSVPPQYSFEEDSLPIIIGSGIQLSDPDELPLMNATIRLFLEVVGATSHVNDFIQLATSPIGSHGLTISSTTNSIYITGAASHAVYMSVLSRLQFGSIMGEPVAGSRLVLIEVFDGEFVSNSLLVTVIVQLINDNRPELDLSLGEDGLGYQVSFREGGIFTFLTGPDLRLTDLDGDTIQSVRVNLTNSIDPEELLGSLAFGRVRVVNTDYGLDLVGPATASEFELALQTVYYENSAEEPSNPQEARIVQFIASDGVMNSLPATATITILLVNDAPVIRLMGRISQDVVLVYSESESSLSLVSESVSISDVDSIFLSYANVTVTNFIPGVDQLNYSTESYNISAEFLSGTLLLTGSATAEDYSAVLQSLRYINGFIENDQIDQLQGGKSIQFSISDGSLTSQIARAFVTFSVINDPPIIDLNGPATGLDFTSTFTEGDVTASVTSPLLTVTDVDSSELDYVSAVLANVQDLANEMLIISQNIAGIMSSYNFSSNQLTIQGPSLTSNFELILRSLMYQNTNPEPTPGIRTVTIIANDGEDNSSRVISTITVLSLNDPPQLTLITLGSPFIEESGAITLLSNGSTVSDLDNQTLSTLSVQLENPLDGVNESIFVSSIIQGLIVSESGTSYAFSFHPETLGSVQQFNLVLQGLAYNNTSPEPMAGTRYVNITVSDGLQSSPTIIIPISIELVNDNAPEFADDFVLISVPEDMPIHSSIFQASASDSDRDSVILYGLNAVNTMFTVSPTTGIVILANSLDRETEDFYTLDIVANDSINTVRMVLQIEVTDVNDNRPMFTTNTFIARLAEDSPLGTFTVRLLASDNDEGSNANLRFTISEGNAQRLFSINSTSGKIVTSSTLNFEVMQSHSLSVMVEDSGNPRLSDTAFVLIGVIDINDNAPIFSPSQAVINFPEDTPVTTTLYSTQATDADANTQLTFTLVNGSSELFVVDPDTGGVILIDKLDFESETFHFIEVEVSDGNFTSTFSLTLSVSDVDDNKPEFIQDLYTVSIPEDLNIGSDILQGMTPLMVVDLDTGSNAAVQFILESVDPINQTVFVLNTLGSTSASLILAGGLDREVTAEYTLFIVSQNPMTPSQNDTAVVVITVTDINDSPPVFDLPVYNFSVAENSRAYTSIGQVTSVDNDVDSNAQIQYAITSGDFIHYFNITTSGDIVTTTSMLDYETNTQFILMVQAMDGGNPPLSAQTTVVISVLDINDNQPVFTEGVTLVSILENTPPSTTIAILRAVDQDSGQNGEVNYFLYPNSVPYFSINPATGVLTTTGDLLDFESDSTEFLLNVTARDNGFPQLSSDAQVIINLLDVNEFSPMFSINSTRIQVIENTPPFSVVFLLNATDGDSGTAGEIEFTLVDNQASSPFAVDNTTGEIFTTMRLDRETSDQYVVTVQVFNPLGSPSLSSFISLTFDIYDINDNPPVFTQNRFSATITTNEVVGSTILTIIATDADIGLNGDIEYFIADHDGQFNISKTTGALFLTTAIRIPQTFNLIIVASDGGDPSLSSNVSVTINVIHPLQVEFNQQGSGFLLNHSSPTSQNFGFFVNLPPGSNGEISATLSNVTVGAAYNTSLPEAANVRGVVLRDEVWYDDAEISVVVQVTDNVGDVHCSPTQVVITIVPEDSLRALLNLNPQVSILVYTYVSYFRCC